MLSETIRAERVQRARGVLDATARKLALRRMTRERGRLLDELVRPYESPHSTADPLVVDETRLCQNLVVALRQRRADFVERSAAHATPGIGREAMAFLDIDDAVRHEQLRLDIERLERAIEAVGCPI